jgi:hypothetical protein
MWVGLNKEKNIRKMCMQDGYEDETPLAGDLVGKA